MKFFGKNKKQFDYQSDTQLVSALIAGQQAAFDYVFDRYHELLHSNIKSAFHIKNKKDDVERVFKKRCGELQAFLLDNDSAKLKLFDPKILKFEVWLATVSLTFFKKSFCKENTDAVERYRNGGKDCFYEPFRHEFEEMIRITGENNTDIVGDALSLANDVYMHLKENNWKRLSTYDPSRQTFDVWFGWVLRNYAIDQFRKRTKKSNEDAYNSINLEKKGDDMIEYTDFFRIDNQEAFPGWEKEILNIDDEEKIEVIEIVRKTVLSLQPPRYCDILVDRYYDGMEYEVIAQKYHITKENAQNIVSRALKRLKEKLVEYEYWK